MLIEEDSVNVVVDAPLRGAQRLRPQMRSVGFAHAVAALALLGVLAFGSLRGCTGVEVQVIPAGMALALFILLSSFVMVVRVPRVSAVAPALALGASLPLFGGAVAGWTWVVTQPCMGNVLDREVVTLHIVTAASAAVVATSLWLLISRDEIEPWHATSGVVVATAGALTVLVLGVGFTVLLDSGTPLAATTLAVTIPWAIAVGAAGWLRPSPALAMVAPGLVQALWLLAR
jgi:hypothetical protein